MQCSCTCEVKQKTSPLPQQNVVLQTTESTKIGANVARVLVNAADVEITLPYQPAPGTSILISTRSTGTTVVPGCAAACGCSSDDEEECDTFCNEETSIALAECTQLIATYHPPDPCNSETLGTWVTETVAPVEEVS